MKRTLKVGDLVAESPTIRDIAFVTKVDKQIIYIHFIHGIKAGKIYSTHKDWLVHVDDIIHEDDE